MQHGTLPILHVGRCKLGVLFQTSLAAFERLEAELFHVYSQAQKGTSSNIKAPHLLAIHIPG